MVKNWQKYLTTGAFVNHYWNIGKKISLESGLRCDVVQASSVISKSNEGAFVLPRISVLYKMNSHISYRLGGGMGYRMPTLFNEESEPFGYKNIRPIDFAGTTAEKSYGGNFDFKYQSTFGTQNILLTFNQMFFYNIIDHPILLSSDTLGNLFYGNYGNQMTSIGFESQIKLTFWQFTWFLGYTFTDVFMELENSSYRLPLTPRHSIKGDLLFVVDDKWRIGWDYEYKSEQMLSTGITTRELFTTGVVVERTMGYFTIFLNAENFTDTRQSRYESLESLPFQTPQFTEVWAPLDGFFFNGGFKIRM